MTEITFETLKDLENVRSVKKKKEITEKIFASLKLSSSNSVIESYLRITLIPKVIFQINNDYDIDETETFYDIDFFIYEDNDGFAKLALFVSYLQDYRNIIDDLDVKILKGIMKDLAVRNLELVVNDISINSYQARNGKIIHRILGEDKNG